MLKALQGPLSHSSSQHPQPLELGWCPMQVATGLQRAHGSCPKGCFLVINDMAGIRDIEIKKFVAAREWVPDPQVVFARKPF